MPAFLLLVFFFSHEGGAFPLEANSLLFKEKNIYRISLRVLFCTDFRLAAQRTGAIKRPYTADLSGPFLLFKKCGA